MSNFANLFSVKQYIDSKDANDSYEDISDFSYKKNSSQKQTNSSISNLPISNSNTTKPNQVTSSTYHLNDSAYSKIKPSASILKYSEPGSNSSQSNLLSYISYQGKENDKTETRKYTKNDSFEFSANNTKNKKEPASKKMADIIKEENNLFDLPDKYKDLSKPKAPKTLKTAKYSSKAEKAENDLHGLNDLEEDFEEMNKIRSNFIGKPINPISNAGDLPNITSDLSRPALTTFKGKQKPYEFANVNYWNNTTFPWTQKLLPVMEHFFGFRVFRSNQRAIINATLAKKDVFVCLPTGGGKSLTFQLPAIIDKGVTLVVMPLLALIYDQTTQMEQKNISVLNLSGASGSISSREYNQLLGAYRDSQSIMDQWHYTEEMPYPKMIFTTPEKIVQSETTMNFLRNLYHLGLLDRIVIDEAHCVSQWGRDFRKDYLNLKILKEEFPNVSMIALTATATEEIKVDICQQLKMKNVLYFQNSFNRKNLIFEVRQKGKDAVADVASFIEDNYPRKCGIIFTSSTQQAETVAKTLRTKHRMKCEFYHAKMSEKSRNEVQEMWMNDEINVIVATIAFGMGVNKLDVRFVIHFNFSKSISNYYQEAGRAGRDGQKAHCVIFYKYGDRVGIDYLNFHNQSSTKQMKQENNWELMNVIKYCEDVFSCRRAMVLSYFGERLDKEECGKTCDNCRAGRIPVVKDFTEEAKKAINFLKNRENNDYSMNQLVQLLSGRVRDKTKPKFANETEIGVLKSLKLTEVEILVKELIIKRFLVETLKKTRGKVIRDFLSTLGVERRRSELLFQGKEKVYIAFPGLKRTESQVGDLEKDKGKAQEKETKPQRIYIRQKSEENTITNIKQKKTFDLEQFAFNSKKPIGQEDFTKDDKKKFVYTEEYGFCTSVQFEEILDRLKLVRKSIFNQAKSSNNINLRNTTNLDAIIPIEGLYELCRKLPTSPEELAVENIRNVGAKQLQEHGHKFLDEISHFVKLYQINKNEFVFPQQKEEETKEIFDIQDHFYNSQRIDNYATDEWNFEAFNDETRLPSVTKSGSKTEISNEPVKAANNPEIEFDIHDFADFMSDEEWKHLDNFDDVNDQPKNTSHNTINNNNNISNNNFNNPINKNFAEEKSVGANQPKSQEINYNDYYDDDDMDLIEKILREEEEKAEEKNLTVKNPINTTANTNNRQYQTYQSLYQSYQKQESKNYGQPAQNKEAKGNSFFDLYHEDNNQNTPNNGSGGTGYISMHSNPLKRDREKSSQVNSTDSSKIKKQFKFL